MTRLWRLIIRVFWFISQALSRGHRVRVWPGGSFIEEDDLEYAMTTYRRPIIES